MEKMKCVFCETSSLDENLGEFKELSNYQFHSNCLVYSWDTRQNKDRSKGLYGFEVENIEFTLNRAQNRICSFCSKKGASLRCYEKTCELRFHLPCALKSKQTIHLHFKIYQSYCSKHNPHSCLFDCDPITGINFNAPCCKQLFGHEDCIKKLVIKAKAQSKCSNCQDVDNFRTFVERNLDQKIPKGRPSYARREHTAYDVQCAAKVCNCPDPDGRFFHNENSDYELILCQDCGSDAIHRSCGKIDENNQWICPACDLDQDVPLEPIIGSKRKRKSDIFEPNKKKTGSKNAPKIVRTHLKGRRVRTLFQKPNES